MKLWLVVIACVCVSLVGCAESDGNSRDLLNVTLFNVAGKGMPTPGAATFRVVAVARPGGKAGVEDGEILAQSRSSLASGSGDSALESLPEDQPMMLLFEGLDLGNKPVFSGGTGTFSVLSTAGKATSHSVFLSAIGAVSPAMALQPDGSWVKTAFEDGVGRAGHASVALADGRALIIGGGTVDAQGRPLGAVDNILVYEPSTGRFEVAVDNQNLPLLLSAPRVFHSATVFADGRILVAGGYSVVDGRIETLRSAEWIEPRLTGSFSRLDAAPMNDARAKHTATLRADNALLITGGEQGNNVDGVVALSSAEIFEPSGATFTLAPAMTTARVNHAAVLMSNGSEILLIGGSNGQQPLASMELFSLTDALIPQFQHWNDLLYAREGLGAARFEAAGGRYIAIMGGRGPTGATVGEVELWDVVEGGLVVTSPLNIPRSDFAWAYAGDGLSAAIVGGLDTARQPTNIAEWLHLDAALGTFSIKILGTRLSQARAFPSAARLPHGLVLITGGQGADLVPSSSADVLNTGLPSLWASGPPEP